LQESITNGILSVIVTINPNCEQLGATIDTLKFGLRAGNITTTAEINVAPTVPLLMAEVERLKAIISRRRRKLGAAIGGAGSPVGLEGLDEYPTVESTLISELQEKLADLDAILNRK